MNSPQPRPPCQSSFLLVRRIFRSLAFANILQNPRLRTRRSAVRTLSRTGKVRFRAAPATPGRVCRHMLRLTKKADYGLMALKYLAEQARTANASAAQSAKDIAEAYHIPPQLLAKILQTLARAGCWSRTPAPTAATRWPVRPPRSPPLRSSAPSTARSSSPVASQFTEPATWPAIAPSKNHCARSTTASRTCSAASPSPTSSKPAIAEHHGSGRGRRRPGQHRPLAACTATSLDSNVQSTVTSTGNQEQQ